MVSFTSCFIHILKEYVAVDDARACDLSPREADSGGLLQMEASLGYTVSSNRPEPQKECLS